MKQIYVRVFLFFYNSFIEMIMKDYRDSIKNNFVDALCNMNSAPASDKIMHRLLYKPDWDLIELHVYI